MENNISQCIAACLKAMEACNECAAACLAEEHVNHMRKCIQLDLECAAVCETTVRLLSLGTLRAKEICHLCAEFCMACAAECSTHDMEHCLRCSEACALCAEKCRVVASTAVAAAAKS
jgi:hypothetical protein